MISNLRIEKIDNPEQIFWIWKEKISNKSSSRIYPAFDSNVASGESVAVYEINGTDEKQIAVLSLPNYDLLKKKYDNGEEINLNYTYIDDFGWLGNRKPYETENEPYRKIKSFSADASIWNDQASDTKEHNHILSLEIENGDLSFYYSCFNQINIGIMRIKILSGNFDFSYSSFYDSEVYVSEVAPLGNTYFSSEISFRYTQGRNVKISVDFLNQMCSVDFLLSKIEESTVEIDGLPKNINTICLTRSQLENFSVTNADISALEINDAVVNNLNFLRCRFNGVITIAAKIRDFSMCNCIISDVMKIEIPSPESIGFDDTIISGKMYFTDFENVLQALLRHVKDTGKNGQLLVLKENFRQIGQYRNEDICHLHYMRNKAVSGKNMIYRWSGRFLDILCGYGTKPFRLLLAILVIIVSFAVLYRWVPALQFDNVEEFIDYFYVSGITFFTVGYGDVLPVNGITKLVVILESFLGVGFMSALLALLTRKVIR